MHERPQVLAKPRGRREALAEEHRAGVEPIGVTFEQLVQTVGVGVRVDDAHARQIDRGHRASLLPGPRSPLSTASGAPGRRHRRPSRRTPRARPCAWRRRSRRACPPSPRAGRPSARAPRSRRRATTGAGRSPLASLARRERRRILEGRLGEPQVAFEPVEAGGDDGPEDQVRVAAPVHGLDLQVRRLRAAADHPRHEPEPGLAVLAAPRLERTRPPVRLEPQVARDRRAGDRDDRRQGPEDPGGERLGLTRHPLGSVAAGEPVAPAPVPQAEVQVIAVADQAGEHDRGERDREPVRARDRADRVPGHEVGVGDRDPGAMRHGDLELPGRVLGVELHHAGPLPLERADRVGRERLLIGEHGGAVAGTDVGGDRLRLVGLARGDAVPEEELELVRAPELEPVGRQALEHAPRERAPARRPGVPLLVALVDGGERPSGRCGQRDRRGRIGHEPRVAGRTLDPRRRGDAVVDQEDREHVREADAEPRDLLEPPDRDALHARDPGGVDHRERNRLDPARRQAPRHRHGSAARAPGRSRARRSGLGGGAQNSSRYSIRSQSLT